MNSISKSTYYCICKYHTLICDVAVGVVGAIVAGVVAVDGDCCHLTSTSEKRHIKL